MRFVISSLIIVALTAHVLFADEIHKPSFARGYIHNHHLIVHMPTKHSEVRIYSTNLKEKYVTHIIRLADQNTLSDSYATRPAVVEANSVVGPPSISVHRGRLWLDIHQLDYAAFGILKSTENIQHLDMDEICKGKLEWIDSDNRKTLQAPFGGFFWRDEQDRINRLIKAVGLDPRFQYFTVPVGDHAAVRFELAFSAPLGKPLRAAQMSVHQLERKYDEQKKLWLDATVKHVEEIPVEFRESFDAIISGKDYLFLTHSGKLYRAEPSTERNKPRRAELVEGLPGPIVALIRDTNKPGEDYLVCHDGDSFYYKPLHNKGKSLRVAKRQLKDAQLPYEPILEHVQTLIRDERIVLPADKKR